MKVLTGCCFELGLSGKGTVTRLKQISRHEKTHERTLIGSSILHLYDLVSLCVGRGSSVKFSGGITTSSRLHIEAFHASLRNLMSVIARRASTSSEPQSKYPFNLSPKAGSCDLPVANLPKGFETFFRDAGINVKEQEYSESSNANLLSVDLLAERNNIPNWGGAGFCPLSDLYIHPALCVALQKRGIERLTRTQTSAFCFLNRGKDVFIHEPKTEDGLLGVILPILSRLYEAADVIQATQTLQPLAKGAHAQNIYWIRDEDLVTKKTGNIIRDSSDDGISKPAHTDSLGCRADLDGKATQRQKGALQKGWVGVFASLRKAVAYGMHTHIPITRKIEAADVRQENQEFVDDANSAKLKSTELVEIQEKSNLNVGIDWTDSGSGLDNLERRTTSPLNPLGSLRPFVILCPSFDGVLSLKNFVQNLDVLGRVRIQCLTSPKAYEEFQTRPDRPVGGDASDSCNPQASDNSSDEWKRLASTIQLMTLKAKFQANSVQFEDDKFEMNSNYTPPILNEIDQSPAFSAVEVCKLPVIFRQSIRWGGVDIVLSTPFAFYEELSRHGGKPLYPSVLVLQDADALLQQEKLRTILMQIFKIIRPRPPINALQIPKGRTEMPPTQLCVHASTCAFQGATSAGVMLLERFGNAELIKGEGVHQLGHSCAQYVWVRMNEILNMQSLAQKYPPWHSEKREEEIQKKSDEELRRVRDFILMGRRPEDKNEIRENDMDEEVNLEVIREYLGQSEEAIVTECERKKSECLASMEQKKRVLLFFFDWMLSSSAEGLLKHFVVFCNSVSTCRGVYNTLKGRGWAVESYHKGLSIKRRLQAIESYKKSNPKGVILVASDMLTRTGVVDMRTHVVNFDFPNDTVTYIHRTAFANYKVQETSQGRVGGSLVLNLLCKEDVTLASQICAADAQNRPLHSLFSRKKSLRKKMQFDRLKQKFTSNKNNPLLEFAQIKNKQNLPTRGSLQKIQTRTATQASNEKSTRNDYKLQVSTKNVQSDGSNLRLDIRAKKFWRSSGLFEAIVWDESRSRGFLKIPNEWPLAANFAPLSLEEALSDSKSFSLNEMRVDCLSTYHKKNAENHTLNYGRLSPKEQELWSHKSDEKFVPDSQSTLKSQINFEDLDSGLKDLNLCSSETNVQRRQNVRQQDHFNHTEINHSYSYLGKNTGINIKPRQLCSMDTRDDGVDGSLFEWNAKDYQKLVISRFKKNTALKEGVRIALRDAEVKRTKKLLRNFEDDDFNI